MEITKEQLESYLSNILAKRKVIKDKLNEAVKNGNLANLSKKDKLVTGGLWSLSLEIDAEILAIINFVDSFFKPIPLSESILSQVEELKKSKISLISIEDNDIKLPEQVEEYLKSN